MHNISKANIRQKHKGDMRFGKTMEEVDTGRHKKTECWTLKPPCLYDRQQFRTVLEFSYNLRVQAFKADKSI